MPCRSLDTYPTRNNPAEQLLELADTLYNDLAFALLGFEAKKLDLDRTVHGTGFPLSYKKDNKHSLRVTLIRVNDRTSRCGDNEQ